MSKPHRILFLGSSGQIGQAIQQEPLPVELQLISYARNELDITNHSAVRDVVQRQKPDLIINAAAMTNVDQAERDEQAAMAANFEAPANLAAQCSMHDIPLIHLSTDYVFDGEHNAPYLFNDPMNPINVYGKSKMMGEEAVREELAWHVILRLSSMFSAFSQNIMSKAIAMIDERDELRMVTDQITCPTPAVDVAKAIITIAANVLDGKSGAYGLFHFCGDEPCTRFEFTEEVMKLYAPHTARRPKLMPAVSSEFSTLAQRPRYSVLDCAKIKRVYGIEQPLWREGLKTAIEQFVKNRTAA